MSVVKPIKTNPMKKTILALALAAGITFFSGKTYSQTPNPAYRQLQQNLLIAAELWSNKPAILCANWAFEGIIGVGDGKSNAVIEAGGAWESLSTTNTNPPLRAYTSAASTNATINAYGTNASFASAMPIVFTWPVLPSTVAADDFQLILNTGEAVTPQGASVCPNYQYNARNTVVIIGQFGNRLSSGETDVVYPVQIKVVKNLKLVGPKGPVSAVGMSILSESSGYTRGGPKLVGAKISLMETNGDNAPSLWSGSLPNDGITLYGTNNAQFRIRLLTSGGMSPDGVRSMYPTEYASYFRLRVLDGTNQIWLTQTGSNYTTSKGNIQVVGLANLGPKQGSYDDSYVEDHNNQIDIVLKGDRAAMHLIKQLEIPASGSYSRLYNPGGPGNNPTPDVIYTSEGPYQIINIADEINRHFTVSYNPLRLKP
jgi:hypothetical protein